MSPADARTSAINDAATHLVRDLVMAEARATKAANRGAEFAAVVYRYIENPQGVGRDALREAYGRFMAAHAGNFGPSI